MAVYKHILSDSFAYIRILSTEFYSSIHKYDV